MKIKILERNKQPLLYREEIKADVEFDKEVPSRTFIREQIAKSAKVDVEKIVVDKIKSHFGKNNADVLVYIYDDKKKYDSFVSEHMKKKHVIEKKEEPEEDKKEKEEPEQKAEEPKDKKEEKEKKEESEEPKDKKEEKSE